LVLDLNREPPGKIVSTVLDKFQIAPKTRT
jgi:hypothetical protein